MQAFIQMYHIVIEVVRVGCYSVILTNLQKIFNQSEHILLFAATSRSVCKLCLASRNNILNNEHVGIKATKSCLMIVMIALAVT